MKTHVSLLSALATATLLATIGLGASPAVAAPQLSIAVDNDHTSVKPGDSLDYSITIRNLGASDVKSLYITQSVATGLKFDSAGSSGRLADGNVRWTLDVPANGSATVHSTMTVGKTSADLRRVATVACARTTVTGPPIVCASHFAKLPAKGAATSSTSSGGRLSWYLGGGAILLAAVAAGAVVLTRRRRSAPAPADEALSTHHSHRADP